MLEGLNKLCCYRTSNLLDHAAATRYPGYETTYEGHRVSVKIAAAKRSQMPVHALINTQWRH